MSGKRNKLEDLGDYEMEPAMAARADRMIAKADAQLGETRVNFRWGKRHVMLVKTAADLIGIPYQIYIKEAAYRQALKDIREAQDGMLTMKQWLGVSPEPADGKAPKTRR